MHTTVRRYEGIDQTRKSELTKKVSETLLPRLSKMPGFSGYYLIDTEKDVVSSISFFDTSAQADESTRFVASWLREEKLENVLPNSPKITVGEVIVHKMNGAVKASAPVSTPGRPASRGPSWRARSSAENDHYHRVRPESNASLDIRAQSRELQLQAIVSWGGFAGFSCAGRTRTGDLLGLAVHTAARICAVGHT